MWGRILNAMLIGATVIAFALALLSAVRLVMVSVPLGMSTRVSYLSGHGNMTLRASHADRQPTVSLQYFIKSPEAMAAHNQRQQRKNLPVIDFDQLRAFSVGSTTESLPDGSERSVYSLTLPWWLLIIAFAASPAYSLVRYLRTPRCRNCKAVLTGVLEDECPDCAYPIPPAVRQRIAKLTQR